MRQIQAFTGALCDGLITRLGSRSFSVTCFCWFLEQYRFQSHAQMHFPICAQLDHDQTNALPKSADTQIAFVLCKLHFDIRGDEALDPLFCSGKDSS